MDTLGNITTYNEDCLIGMSRIADGSVDCIICDLPYGVLNKANPSAKWDCQLPLDELWRQYLRIIKPNGAIILFGQGMFTAKLMMSQPKLWRYNLIWKKGNRISSPMSARIRPLPNHEDIMVFYKQKPTYNPQMSKGKANHSMGNIEKYQNRTNNCYGEFKRIDNKLNGLKYPKSVLIFERDYKDFLHPTQKPVALIEYLIRTYTNEGELVLDNCMGSGTTAIACMNTNRKFIGFELDADYYAKAVQRIKDHQRQLTMF